MGKCVSSSHSLNSDDPIISIKHCSTDEVKDEREGAGSSTTNKNEESKFSDLKEKYLNAMNEITGYGIFSSIEGLCDRSSFTSHKNDAACSISTNYKKIMKELHKTLPKTIYISSNGSMFIRFDENNPRFIQALLTGGHNTPYSNGLFLFDIYLQNDYPTKPPQIKHITKGGSLCHANNGPGGFSPNLHQSTGKVCLSLLGTWDGPGWENGKSNIYQILSTLLFMVFSAEHPYYMEPNHGGWEGTALSIKNHNPKVIEYDEEVMYHTAKYAILDTLKKPYTGFEDVIKIHFKIKQKYITDMMEKWINDETYSKGFKNKITPIYEQIKKELNKLSV